MKRFVLLATFFCVLTNRLNAADKFNVLFFAVDDLRRGEHDLDISRRRKNRDGADLVIDEPWEKHGIDR